MEFVKDDLQYSETGGIYVSKGKQCGWKLLTNDADLSSLTAGVKHGDRVDFYLDNVVDHSIEPVNQMQPHVTIRPRQDIFAGNYLLPYFINCLDLVK